MPPAAAGPVIWGPSATSAIAGAEIVRLNEALGETFGVKSGVLVLNVGSGTPAERSGLRGGDVIVSANGNPVAAPQAMSLAVRRARDRQVSLEIVRKSKKQTVVLRW
jgi:S1-C subfamily serine protease